MDKPYEPSEQDNQFLNEVDMGYIGLSQPQVIRIREDGPPTWVARRFEKLARNEGIAYYEFLDKYKPSFDPNDWDKINGIDDGEPPAAYYREHRVEYDGTTNGEGVESGK